MKKILLLLTCIALSSCSQTIFNYADEKDRKSVNLVNDRVKVKSVNIKLYEVVGFKKKSSIISPESKYLDAKSMSSLIKKDIISRAKKDGIYEDPKKKAKYQVNISMEAMRGMMIFTKDKYAGLSQNEISIEVLKDNSPFADKYIGNDNGRATIICGRRGTIANTIIIFKRTFLLGGPEDEIEDVKVCSKAIYETIKQLGN